MPQKTNHNRTAFILFPGHLKQPYGFLVRCPEIHQLLPYILKRQPQKAHQLSLQLQAALVQINEDKLAFTRNISTLVLHNLSELMAHLTTFQILWHNLTTNVKIFDEIFVLVLMSTISAR